MVRSHRNMSVSMFCMMNMRMLVTEIMKMMMVVALMAQLVWSHSCVADRLPVVVRIPAGP